MTTAFDPHHYCDPQMRQTIAMVDMALQVIDTAALSDNDREMMRLAIVNMSQLAEQYPLISTI